MEDNCYCCDKPMRYDGEFAYFVTKGKNHIQVCSEECQEKLQKEMNEKTKNREW